MKPHRLLTLIAAACTAALSGHAQSLLLDSVYTFHNNGGAFVAGASLSSNQTLSVGNSISDLGVSAWAGGSYYNGSYNQAEGTAFIGGTASGGDAFGRLAVTMEYDGFGSSYSAGTTLWYAQTIVNGNVATGSYNSGIYGYSPGTALRVMTGDEVYLGINARDTTYTNNATGIGHGATFRVVNAPDVTISGGTASWSVLDNSAADTDLASGSTMIDRNGGLLSLDYLLQDLEAARGLVQGFDTSAGSPFRDDVSVTLQLMLTGTNAIGVTDTFLLDSTDATKIFSADANTPSLAFDSVDGTAFFDPTDWSDGDFTLSLDVTINQLAYGHEDAFLDLQLLGSLSASQSFTLFTGASAVPEPGTYALLAGLGALGLARVRRRREQASS